MHSPPGGFGPPPGGYPPPPPGGYAGYPAGPAGASASPKPITGSAETMALHAMTIDPKTGLPKGERPPASPAAVLALVCGILLCLGPLTGLTAIISGIVGRAHAQKQPTTVGGAGMAGWGIALGVLNLLISLLGLAYYVLSQMS